jgi:hypothetical protein
MGAAFAPLTAAGLSGVGPTDAGAASGLVNVAHQLGGSLGLGMLVTVFASAQHAAADATPFAARDDLAQAVATALTGSAILLAVALVAVVLTIWRPFSDRVAVDVADAAR